MKYLYDYGHFLLLFAAANSGAWQNKRRRLDDGGRERSIIYRIARSVRAALEATLECNNIDFVLVFDVEAVNLGWKFDCHGYRLN